MQVAHPEPSWSSLNSHLSGFKDSQREQACCHTLHEAK